VDLLLAVFAVVVFGIAVVVGGHVDDLHAERFDPELGPGALEGTAENGLHVVDLLHRVCAHGSSLRVWARSPGSGGRDPIRFARTFVLFDSLARWRRPPGRAEKAPRRGRRSSTSRSTSPPPTASTASRSGGSPVSWG